VDQAGAILARLHREILAGGFHERRNDLAQTFVDGRFNCVCSTVLFITIARQLGLDARAVEVPGHVFCRLYIEGDPPAGAIDVETTVSALGDAPRQFEIGAKGGGRAMERVLDDTQLVALILYNQGIERLEERRFADAVAANLCTLRLDPHSPTARGNLLVSLNNWALNLCRENQFDRAAEVLACGLAVAPDHENFLINDQYIRQKWREHQRAAGEVR
jgi:hypothetical protein